MSTIRMKNENTGQLKEVPIGFSWTTFFFGWFPALLRGDWKNFLILFFLTVPTLGIILIFYWFKYNKIYIKDLISREFKAILSQDEAAFMSAKIGVYLPIFEGDAYPGGFFPQTQNSKVRLLIACCLGISIALGVIGGNTLQSVRGGESRVIATTLPASGPIVTSKANKSPEPVNAKALVFVKNALIEDIVRTMRGDLSALPEFAPTNIPISVTSLELSKAYSENEFNADEKYKSKQVIVSGEVVGIRKDLADDVIIDLPSGNQFMDAHAELASSARYYAGMISKDEAVKLVCSVKGAIVGSVVMSNCQPLHWVAEEAADKQIKKLNAWLSRGGKSPFALNANVSSSLAAMYLLGTMLPDGHICVEQVAHKQCLSAINLEQQFKDNDVKLKAGTEKWRDWLQLSEAASAPAA